MRGLWQIEFALSPHAFYEVIMKPNHIVICIPQEYRIGISKRNAYHHAGHAAAIHFINQQLQLPAVHFQIAITSLGFDGKQSDRLTGIYSKYSVTVEGGRLINLPYSFAEATLYLSGPQLKKYRCAFEADIINLLAGYLAEAKYVASRDNESFNSNLINLNALHFYGGNSVLAGINEYMDKILTKKEERDMKLSELFLAAFKFINKRSNWRAITTLAEFIQNDPKDIISCEEVISLLESV